MGLKYKVIESEEQYYKYCNTLENLILKSPEKEDEIKLLKVLIQTWDQAHNEFEALDPIELIKALMDENGLKQKDLVEILDIGKSTVSEILSYKRGLTKENIRRIAERFKISQESLNKPYKLENRFNIVNKKTTSAN